MAIATGTHIGPYEILGPLGAGGMGEVYRARDTRLGRDVAIKVLPQALASDPDRQRRFEQEARAAGRLDHPNILVVHDAGTDAGVPYLVTELLEGETLRARMGGAALPTRKAIEYALQIARGLAAAHERGLVHRDLKPENLFVLRDGRVKILDFGIAKLTRPEASGGATATAPDTDPGVVMGTVGYMAPEQVRGQPADHRADLFAFGAILYEMLSGSRAFKGETSADTMTAILREDPPELSRAGHPIPPALDRIVRHCLEKSPQERFQSASDVAFALESLSGISDSGPKPTVPGGPARRRFLVPALAALLLLTAGVLAGRQLAAPTSRDTVEYKKLTFRRGFIQAARFSGNGHSVYYSASWDGAPPEVFSSDINSPGVPAGLSNTYLLAVSRSNELAILLRPSTRPHGAAIGTLARSSQGGAPREILDNVSDADWSPDGSSLAVIHVLGNRYRLEYPVGRVLYESRGWITHPRVSPRGDLVAFLEHSVFPDDRGVVMVAGPKRAARILSRTFASAQGLAWSPSGEKIFFSASLVASGRSVYSVDLKGRERKVATLPGGGRVQDLSPSGELLITSDNASTGIRARAKGEAAERDLSWLDWSLPTAISRDGQRLLFSEQGEGGGTHYAVCIREMDGSPPVRLGEGQSDDLSPDGAWALTTRFWTKPPEQVLLPTGTGEPRVLPPTGLENLVRSEFFPSGNRLLILGNEPGRATRAYVRDLEGGPLRPIAPEGISFRPRAVSPDQKWAVGFIRGGEAAAYPLEGGGAPRPVRGKQPEEVPLGWSADGKSMYVMRPGTRPIEIFRLDYEAGKRTPWARIEGPEDRAGINLGILVLGRDDHSYAYTYSRTISALYLAGGMR